MRHASCGLLAVLFCLAIFGTCSAAETTVLYGDHVTKLADAPDGTPRALWVTPLQLTEISGFVLKPEGVCLDEICIPIDQDAAAGFVRAQGDAKEINLAKLAEKLGQPRVVDAEQKVWSFGPRPALGGGSESLVAPDFGLVDRTGKMVHLSDFRGKKVLLVTWASWCGCRLDLAGWQKLYEELKDKNFEIVAVAEDTGGEAAAGRYYDQAKATYTTLIDPQHVVSSLYHMVNVPMGVWIDEAGRIVRPAEVAYSKNVALLGIKVEGDRYAAGLRDWVAQGEKSAFALSADELRKRMAPPDPKLGLADANFKLGVYLHQQGDDTAAAKYWSEAQTLAPDNWNYHRQPWSFTPAEANGRWMKKYGELKGKGQTYYPPLDLPKVDP